MLYTPDLCIYHGNCDDGFTAAWAIWKRWPNCKFVPGLYGKDPPSCSDKHVLLVDFSYKRDVLEMLGQFAKSVTVIDHHKTAQADLETFATYNPVDADNIEEVLAATQPGLGNIRAWFDMEQSGAMMAWKFAHPGALIPRFVEYIQDRDLWKFEYGEATKQFSASLRTYPMEFEVWDKLIPAAKDLVKDGEAILRAHNANIAKFIKEVYDERIGDHTVPVVNVPYHYASDVAHAMLKEYPHAPFAACWFRRADGMIQWSLRSEDSRVDVSEVAKQIFGGGGHRNAAGYQVTV